MQAHLLTVPFENVDVQLGVPVSTRPEDAYEKVVGRKRGGWCFEQNGLFKWALAEIGFEVQSLAGVVGRVDPEAPQQPDHLFLRVDCDGPLFVDVGFGGSLFEPMPLGPCVSVQPPYTLSIAAINNGFYRWTEETCGATSTLDFTLTPVGPNFFDAKNQWLQSDPSSSFVRTLTAQRRFEHRHVILRGLVKRTIDNNGTSDTVLKSSQQLTACLRDDFGLDVPEIATHWEKLKLRHEELFGR